MSEFENRMNALLLIKCGVCQGSGKCDDAEPGDISFREWKCDRCKGTGLLESPKVTNNETKL